MLCLKCGLDGNDALLHACLLMLAGVPALQAGPVVTVSHGIGMPSMSVMLHEVAKLMRHAKVRHSIVGK